MKTSYVIIFTHPSSHNLTSLYRIAFVTYLHICGVSLLHMLRISLWCEHRPCSTQKCHSFFFFLLNYRMYSTGRNFILSCAPRLLLGALLCFSTALLHQVEVSWGTVNVKSTFIAVATLLFFLWHSYLFITCHHTTLTLHPIVIHQGWEVSRVTLLIPDVMKTI